MAACPIEPHHDAGAKVYADTCAACHGDKLQGNPAKGIGGDALRRVLERYRETRLVPSARASHAALFASEKRGPMTACSMARFFTAIYREAGIAGASSHSGRRTLITRLAERGIDLKSIAQIAGHTSIRTTATYVEANSTRLVRILQGVTF